jgi:Peptidase family C25/Secretion system C-terminal sorting domain/Propeptide_C25
VKRLSKKSFQIRCTGGVMSMRFASVLLVLLLATASFAANVVSLSDDVQARSDLEFETVAASVDGITVELNTTGIIIENVDRPEGAFAHIYWNNSGVSGAIGDPEIPVYRFIVEIPYDAEVMASVISESSVVLPIQGSSLLLPVLPPLEKIEGAVQEFSMNQVAYMNDSFSGTAKVSVEDYFIMRGHSYALVAIRPVDYNPAQGLISVTNEIRVHLDFVGGDYMKTAESHERYSTAQFDLLTEAISVNGNVYANSVQLDELPIRPVMIIVNDDIAGFDTALEPYIAWKESMGWDVTLTSINDFNSSASEIKAYIQTAYNDWDVPPSFVLLVGDTPSMPHFVGSGSGNPINDLEYAQLEGTDYFADISVSRFPVRTVDQLNNAINKTLQYEQRTWTGDNDWIKDATFIAGVDNNNITEGTHNWVITNHMDPRGFTSDRVYEVTHNANSGDITTAINDRRGLVIYSGHGSETSWADGPPFSQANVRSLTNDTFPFIQSYACVTGKFDETECFAETWIREDTGALAFMGSSVNSYWDEDDIMEKDVFDGFFANPNGANYTWIYGMMTIGKVGLYAHYGNTGSVRRYFEMYNIMGDGSVNLYSEVPVELDVTMQGTMFLGQNELEVSVSSVPEWAFVSAISSTEEDVLAYGYVDDTGSITLTFDPAPGLPGDLMVAITGHNIATYQASLPIVTAEGPYVVVDSIAVMDAAGWNPNGIFDHSETIKLNIYMKNIGVENAVAPSVTISCENGDLSISDDNEVYTDISVGEVVCIEQGFEVMAGTDIEDLTSFDFDVVTSIGDGDFASTFSLEVCSPIIALIDPEFVEISGNTNEWPDPNETLTMTIGITNSGHSPLITGTINVINSDPMITLTVVDGTFDQVAPGSTGSAQFTMETSVLIPQGHEANFDIQYSSDNGLAGSMGMSFTIGDMNYRPTGPDNYGYAAYDMGDGENSVDFDWTEISADLGGSGTRLNFTQDDQSFHFDMPFTFMYYGHEINEYSVSTNGYVSLSDFVPSEDPSNSGIPAGDGPWAMVAPYWEDLSPQRGNSGGVWSYYDETNHSLIIEFNHVEEYNVDDGFATFQVIFYDPAFHTTVTGDGRIVFQYADSYSPVDGTIGIEDPNEMDGLQYFFNGDYALTAAPITGPYTIAFIPGEYVLLNEPTDLSALLTNEETGIVDLTWNHVDMLTAGVTPGSDDDIESNYEGKNLELGVIDPEDVGREMSLDDLDDLVQFFIYRQHGMNTVLVDSTTTANYQDTLPDEGTYNYYVSAVYDEGQSPASNVATIQWGDVSVDENDGLPSEFAIKSVYPNPFNPTVNVEIAVPMRSVVKAEVYDMLGRRVATLVQDQLSPGYHRLSWTAEGASGIYFLRVQAQNNWSEVRKMIFMK